MKVAFINSLYFPKEIGGAEKAVRVLAEENVKAGGESFVICLSPDGKAYSDTINGVKIYYVPLANVGFLHGSSPLPKWKKLIWYVIDSYNPIMRRRVQKILQDEQPDVIEANNLQGFSVSAWTAARNVGVPIVQVLHDYYLGCINSTMYSRQKNCVGQCAQCKVLSYPRRKLSNIPEIISSVSKRTLEKIQNVGVFNQAKKISIGSSAIRLEDLSSKYERSVHRPSEILRVGYLGRIEPIKGLSILLEAVSLMPATAVELLVAGGGNPEYLGELKSKFNSQNIEFLGVVDPRELFSRIHLLVVPSLWEDPLPRVIAEAQASGIPVAISKHGGMPEIVEDGITGYYFNSNDVGAIKKLFERLIRENLPTPQQVVSCQNRTSFFSVDSVFNRHNALWRDAVSSYQSTKL